MAEKAKRSKLRKELYEEFIGILTRLVEDRLERSPTDAEMEHAVCLLFERPPNDLKETEERLDAICEVIKTQSLG